MLVVHVHIQVKPEVLPEFIAATKENCRASLQEPGVARFDFTQDVEDETRFVLVEAYKTADAPTAHKETPHYQKWRDTVADMMATPRTSTKFRSLAPDDSKWETPSSS